MWCEYFEGSWGSQAVRLARAMIRERWCCQHANCDEPCSVPEHLVEVAEAILQAAENAGIECAAACCDECGEVVINPALRNMLGKEDESIFAAVWDIPPLERFEEGRILCTGCA